jgi:Tol biopolymer transport system component
MIRNCFVLGGAAALVLVGCSGSHIPGTRIFFASNRDGQPAIYSMTANGGNVVRLTDPAIVSTDPSLSTDGTKVVFSTNRDGNFEIYIMNADGTNQVRLTNDPAHDSQPSFSYDGTRVTFARNSSQNPDIYVMDADGASVQQVTTNAFMDISPRFNPAGDKIAFYSQRGLSPEVFMIDVDGTNEFQLSQDENTWNTAPCFMHDGQSLLMVEYTPLTGQKRVIRLFLASRVELPLYSGTHDIRTISLSPDSSHLAYTVIVGAAGEIFRSTLGGTQMTNLTNNASGDETPSFGP